MLYGKSNEKGGKCMIHYICRYEMNKCKIVQNNHNVQIINDTVLHVLDTMCLQNGSTWEGRRKAAEWNLNIHRRIPVLVSESYKDIFFPTKGFKHVECIWINYRAIYKIERRKKGSRIIFLDQSSLDILIDIRTIRLSMKLCVQYLYLLGLINKK